MPDSSHSSGGKRHHRHPRFDYRARSHASAHAQAGSAEPVPDHPLISKAQPSLIDTAPALAELLTHLRNAGSFAYDSEFIGELSYRPKLCLLQVATQDHVGLIDPLAELDLTEFWQLLADPTVEKIVHAGQQDLEPLVRHLNQSPANIFDVQIASGFAALAYPAGLSKLVRELIGVQLGKGFTFTHWDQRPLSHVQLRYAADDVRYLPAVRQEIGKRLAELNHAQWAAEECATLCDPSLYQSDRALDFGRIRGANSLSPRGLAILRELVIWREQAARTNDSPPRSYVRDDILIDISRNPAASAAGLNRVRGLPRPVEEAEGRNIIEAIQRGLAVPEADWPAIAQQEELPGERFSTDALWAIAQAWCFGNQVDPNLTCSRQELGRFYRDVRAGTNLADSRLMRGWRGELLGKPLVRLLRGEQVMGVRWEGNGPRANS